MVDYSKWNNIELSDDDGEDCHPNIEKNTWIRLKREQRARKQAEEEQQHVSEVATHEGLVKKIQELEETLKTLSADTDKEKADKVKADIASARKKEQEIAKKLADEEERKKKVVKWNVDTICHEGFSKTIINKGSGANSSSSSTSTTTTTTSSSSSASASSSSKTAAASTSAPSSASATPVSQESPKHAVPAASVVLTENKKNMSEEEMDEYVRQMEIKAHTFANCKNYDEYYEYLRMHKDILIKETNDYLLLHVSDFIKKGQYSMSKKYCIAACLIQYSLELGPQGAQILFHRLRDTSGKVNYRKEFESQTAEYWERVKVKILELQEQRAARKAAGLPEDPVAEGEQEEDEDDESLEQAIGDGDVVEITEVSDDQVK